MSIDDDPSSHFFRPNCSATRILHTGKVLRITIDAERNLQLAVWYVCTIEQCQVLISEA